MKTLISALVISFAVSRVADAQTPMKRDVSVRDSIEMQQFIAPRNIEGPILGDRYFAPDGRHFLIATQKGVLEDNTLQATVWLFDVNKVTTAISESSDAHPKAVATLSGITEPDDINATAAVVRDAQWAADSRHILFLGRNGNTEWHLYKVDIDGGKLVQLTPNGQNVHKFTTSKDSILYSVELPATPPTITDKVVVTGQSLISVLFPEDFHIRTLQLWVIRGGQITPVRDETSSDIVTYRLDTRYPSYELLTLSPDNRHAIVTTEVNPTPTGWDKYKTYDPLFPIPAKDPGGLKIGRPQQYEIVDLKSGRNVLFNAPLGMSLGYHDYPKGSGLGVVWSKRSERCLLLNTFVPIDRLPASEREPLATSSQIVEYNVADNSWNVVAAIKQSPFGEPKHWSLADIKWDDSDDKIVLRYSDGSYPTETYRKHEEKWVLSPTSSVDGSETKAADASSTHPIIVIQQNLNSPPVLAASKSSVEKALEIWNPNPQLKSVNLGEAKQFDWTDSRGHRVRGVLFMPLHYSPGIRYPLVIEPRSYSQSIFIMDGAYSTAAAARPMAAVGIVVLEAGQPEEEKYDEMWEKNDLAYALDGYRSAITKLAGEGIIDEGRVGIFGFSRTCEEALYSITTYSSGFRAATLANGVVDGYLQYMLLQDVIFMPGKVARNYDVHYGGPPYGKYLQTYINEAPAFNLDKIKAAVRIETRNRSEFLFDWEVYSGLRTLQKPVDMIALPNASHVVVMPRDVLESQQGDVDWFRFWLQGYEDPDPDKREQYTRWRELRDLRDADAKATNAQPARDSTH